MATILSQIRPITYTCYLIAWAHFLCLAQSKLRLCSAIHRLCYWTTWPVIGQAQPELTPSRRQKMSPGPLRVHVIIGVRLHQFIFHETNYKHILHHSVARNIIQTHCALHGRHLYETKIHIPMVEYPGTWPYNCNTYTPDIDTFFVWSSTASPRMHSKYRCILVTKSLSI